MTYSSLVDYIQWSPNHSGQRTHKIDRITPHSVVGQAAVETLGNLFANPARQASSNYGVGYDGKIGCYVPEEYRSWCSSSNANDQRAITIEIATDNYEPYECNYVAWQSTIKLCVDICKRYGKKKLIWDNDTWILGYEPKDDEMILTVHKWFGATSCPNTWIMNHMADLATTVTEALKGEEPVPEQTFTDVPKTRSDYKAIEWMYKQGMIKGYKDGTYRPDQPLTRGQLATILWREAGRPNP